MPAARRILLALLAGAVLTLLSAWIPAILGADVPKRADPQQFVEPITTTPGDAPRWAWYATRHHTVAHTAWIFRKGRIIATSYGEPRPDTDVTLPPWAPVPSRGMRVDVHAYAWPWPALTASRHSPGDDHDFLQITRRIALPVRPRGVGLLADVIFWALASVIACISATRVRAALRRRRGRCPACAYDRSGNAGRCPECGHDDAAGPLAAARTQRRFPI